MGSKLILFGCYWNEIDWIEASLEQLRAINPDEVILCDGCFDPEYDVHSTDGTFEIIKEEVNRFDNYSLIEPSRIRSTEYHRLFPQTVMKIGIPLKYLVPVTKIYLSLYIHSDYRINQTFTFNKMITKSKLWKPGYWVMTYDCDQFYSDKIINDLNNLETFSDYDLLTADEYTFFNSFSQYTDQWMERKRSNMPHKIRKDTFFKPTRNIIFFDSFSEYLYEGNTNTKHLGNYFHYKLKKGNRLKKGYQLGDREKDIPEYDRLEFKEIKESQHSKVIRERVFNSDKEVNSFF
jgi:hypothetical protein